MLTGRLRVAVNPETLMNGNATLSQGRLNRSQIDLEQHIVQFIQAPNKPPAFQD